MSATTEAPVRRPFDIGDLLRFEALFESATAVVSMGQVHRGARDRTIIGLRHDVDRDLEAALAFATWEAERGYRATYFLLHTAEYWHEGGQVDYAQGFPPPSAELKEAVKVLVGLGHEVGFHNNALAVSLESGVPAATILAHELKVLRSLGADVIGDAAHGDPLCWDRPEKRDTRKLLFANYEIFVECAKPAFGEPDRTIRRRGQFLTLDPQPMSDFGLEYEAFYLPRRVLVSDSAGLPRVALNPEGDITFGWEDLVLPKTGQLHVLLHPEWWAL